jgi:hypothetical protein
MSRAVPIALAALLALVIACATAGTPFKIKAADSLTPGVTTIDQAIAAIGKPCSETFNEDGSVLVQWQYLYASSLDNEYKHLAILFDRDRKMVRITQRSSY